MGKDIDAEMMMSFDLSPLDWAALLWFLVAWLGYDALSPRVSVAGRSINDSMKKVRFEWMIEMLQREMRMADASLVGHTISSVTFSASTTMIVIAGLVGVLGDIGQAYNVASGLRFAAPMSQSLFESKVLVITGVFVVAFFRFSWSLRQYNYLCALIGAAPSPREKRMHKRAALELAKLMTLAVTSFNQGLRSYYFALCVLVWIAGPGWFALATLGVVAVLLRHHYGSAAARLITAHAVKR
jgi:uncharacterized membrane protein